MKNSYPTQFTKDRQPSAEAKRAGWARKRQGAELARTVLELAFKGLKDHPIKQQASQYFGIPEKEISVEMMMHFAQARKAIEEGDTSAYDALMRRAYGSPKEVLEANVQGTLITLPVDLTADELRELAGVENTNRINWDKVEAEVIEETKGEE